MEVYIEDVILDNLIIDFLILYITAKILKSETKKIFLFIGALAGVGLTILNEIILLNGVLLLIFKLLTAVLMILIAFKIKNFKNLLLNFFTFFITTIIMGGFCFFITFTFGDVMLTENGFAYNLSLPVSVVVLVVVCLGYVLIQLFNALKIKAMQSNFIYQIEINENGRVLKVNGFLDTGNTLVDPLTNSPVCIIDLNFFEKLHKNIPIHKLLMKNKIENLKNAHYVKTGSIGKSAEILVFEVDNLKITQKKFCVEKQKVFLGVSFANFQKKLGCDLILNPQIMI